MKVWTDLFWPITDEEYEAAVPDMWQLPMCLRPHLVRRSVEVDLEESPNG